MSTGNVQFKTPDYEEDLPGDLVLAKLALTLETPATNPVVARLKQKQRSSKSPEVSPFTAQPLLSALSRVSSRRSYAPVVDIQETHVLFAKSPAVVSQESDEDFDDGLLAMPLAKAKPATSQKLNDTSIIIRNPH